MAALAAIAGLSFGCGGRTGDAAMQREGERIQVGPLNYIVLEHKWQTQLGEQVTGRIPKHQFLVVRLTATNSGATAHGVPSLSVENSAGQTFEELPAVSELPEWLGQFRMIEPAQTDEGLIVFDAPPGAYRLRLRFVDDAGDEKTALVNLPLQIEPEKEIPVPK